MNKKEREMYVSKGLERHKKDGRIIYTGTNFANIQAIYNEYQKNNISTSDILVHDSAKYPYSLIIKCEDIIKALIK